MVECARSRWRRVLLQVTRHVHDDLLAGIEPYAGKAERTGARAET